MNLLICKISKLFFLLTFSILLFSGCNQHPFNIGIFGSSKINRSDNLKSLVIVNGVSYKKHAFYEDLQWELTQHSPDALYDDQVTKLLSEKLLQNFVHEQILESYAKQENIILQHEDFEIVRKIYFDTIKKDPQSPLIHPEFKEKWRKKGLKNILNQKIKKHILSKEKEKYPDIKPEKTPKKEKKYVLDLQIILINKKALAKSVLEKALAHPSTFDELAKRYSLDPSSEQNGYIGEHISTDFKSLRPVFKRRRTGVFPQLLESEWGFHIVKVLKSELKSFSQETTEDYLNEIYFKWLESQIKKSQIIWSKKDI